MKIAYETYLTDILKVENEKDRKVESLDDPGLAQYMDEFHPRFYQLVHIYGSPLDMVNLKKQGNNISQTSATLELICGDKVKTKKLLLTMTVT